MADKIQPSGDYLATCAAIAYEIVQSTRKVGALTDPMEMAKMVRRVFAMVAKGIEGETPEK